MTAVFGAALAVLRCTARGTLEPWLGIKVHETSKSWVMLAA
jgi:hypothetical protein